MTHLSFQVISAYYTSVIRPGSRGAAFLAVCRGKVRPRGSGSHTAFPVCPSPGAHHSNLWAARCAGRAGPPVGPQVQQPWVRRAALPCTPPCSPPRGAGGNLGVPLLPTEAAALTGDVGWAVAGGALAPLPGPRAGRTEASPRTWLRGSGGAGSSQGLARGCSSPPALSTPGWTLGAVRGLL